MMKKFLVKCSLFLIIILSLVGIIFLQADGYSDPFYLRFTTPKQSSLILGSSKAAQGLQPKIFNELLDRRDVYNYSFTMFHSPYGPSYLKSIRAKIDSNTNDGIFILTVDPWSISSDAKNPNDSLQFGEVNSFMETTTNVSTNPNIDYLMHSYKGPYIKLLKSNSGMFLHDDGWLEIQKQLSPELLKTKTEEGVETYKNRMAIYKFSKIRVLYLEKTINFLKQFGRVYLVRLPVCEEINIIENEFMPNFNNIIKEINNSTEIEYFDMSSLNSKYSYRGGNHLDISSGKLVSEEISKWIKAIHK